MNLDLILILGCFLLVFGGLIWRTEKLKRYDCRVIDAIRDTCFKEIEAGESTDIGRFARFNNKMLNVEMMFKRLFFFWRPLDYEYDWVDLNMERVEP